MASDCCGVAVPLLMANRRYVPPTPLPICDPGPGENSGLPALQIALPAGARPKKCGSCGIPLGATAYRIPKLKGRYCTIDCVECVLFGRERCRCCGDKLVGKQTKYCSNACDSRYAKLKDNLATCKRLLTWLAKHHPTLYRRVAGENARKCLACGIVLSQKRRDAKYCSPSCRQEAYRGRKSRTQAHPVSTRNTTSVSGPDLVAYLCVSYEHSGALENRLSVTESPATEELATTTA